jgi:hypothetical protein
VKEGRKSVDPDCRIAYLLLNPGSNWIPLECKLDNWALYHGNATYDGLIFLFLAVSFAMWPLGHNVTIEGIVPSEIRIMFRPHVKQQRNAVNRDHNLSLYTLIFFFRFLYKIQDISWHCQSCAKILFFCFLYEQISVYVSELENRATWVEMHTPTHSHDHSAPLTSTVTYHKNLAFNVLI